MAGVLTILVILLSIFVSGYYVKSSPTITTAKLITPIDTSYLQPTYFNFFLPELKLDAYMCTDSDGGINPYMFGIVWRIAKNPSFYCREWVAQYDQMCPPDPSLCAYDLRICTAILAYCASAQLPEECFGTTGVDRCIGSSMVKEYYCSGSDIRYRYISCPRGCSRGACV